MNLTTHSDIDPLVSVENVSKRFCRDLKKSLLYGAQDVFYDLIGKDRSESALREQEFLANDGVSFELRRGECLGLLGKNGAGKTTLLKMLNGLIKPDSGKIEIRGRVGALIALGAGFNPILTGRENVFIAGSVLGLSKKEILGKYAAIVDFAELGDFMESPVQNYSSGMQVRLGFAVASTMDPDVLLIDEVLAVGDTNFKVRCLNRIAELLPTTAVIFVSHNTNQISRICSRCLILNQGKVVLEAPTDQVIQVYNELNYSHTSSKSMLSKSINSCDIAFDSLEINFDDTLGFTVSIESNIDLNACYIRLIFLDPQENSIAEWNSQLNKQEYDLIKGKNTINCKTSPLRFKTGLYRLRFQFVESSGVENLVFSDLAEPLQVSGYKLGHTSVQL